MSAPKVKPLLAGGFRDYLPDMQIQRAAIIRRIQSVYERFGFDPLETPAMERTNVLTGGRKDLDKLLYRSFPARGGRWPGREPDQSTSLRFDLTVPLARVIAANPDLPRPFKRYQVGAVWRGEKPQLGRYREFLQFDADIVGSSSAMADAEMITMMDAVLRELGFERYTIRVNSRNVLNALAAKGGFDDTPDRPAAVIRVLDKLDSMGREAVLRELAAPVDGEKGATGLGLSPDQVAVVERYLDISGDREAILVGLGDLLADVPMGAAGISELRAVLEAADRLGASAERVELDPSVARGLDYYTGVVWECVLDDCPEIGSVYSGGRYDQLVGRFMKDAIVPCTGTSVGVDRLFAGMETLGMLQSSGTVSEVLVVDFAPELRETYTEIARELRDAGIRTAIYLGEDTSFKAQISYAARLGVPYVIIYGPDDAAKGAVQVKDMGARSQEAVSRSELTSFVLSKVRS
jgi:histidyl-tRNA synthetase